SQQRKQFHRVPWTAGALGIEAGFGCCTRAAKRRFQSRYVGYGRESGRTRVRRRFHRERPRRSMAWQPRDLRTEGEHGKRFQSASTCSVNGEPLLSSFAGWKSLRAAAQQPSEYARGL